MTWALNDIQANDFLLTKLARSYEISKPELSELIKTTLAERWKKA
jgi:hypothetical protein